MSVPETSERRIMDVDITDFTIEEFYSKVEEMAKIMREEGYSPSGYRVTDTCINGYQHSLHPPDKRLSRIEVTGKNPDAPIPEDIDFSSKPRKITEHNIGNNTYTGRKIDGALLLLEGDFEEIDYMVPDLEAYEQHLEDTVNHKKTPDERVFYTFASGTGKTLEETVEDFLEGVEVGIWKIEKENASALEYREHEGFDIKPVEPPRTLLELDI